MKSLRPSWLWLGVALTALSGIAAAQARSPRVGFRPQVRNAAPSPAAFRVPPQPPFTRQAQEQDHLQRWMERRSNLTLPQLLRDLETDPAFRGYPPAEQQRLRNLLIRLYNMRPPERDHLLQGNEALERMTPAQRQQFTATTQQYAALPPDRRHMVAQAFARLRRIPPPDRQAAIDSDPLRAQLTPQERNTLSNLLLWAPYFAPQAPVR
jgi:Protein of unknown function (DUF3106)